MAPTVARVTTLGACTKHDGGGTITEPHRVLCATHTMTRDVMQSCHAIRERWVTCKRRSRVKHASDEAAAVLLQMTLHLSSSSHDIAHGRVEVRCCIYNVSDIGSRVGGVVRRDTGAVASAHRSDGDAGYPKWASFEQSATIWAKTLTDDTDGDRIAFIIDYLQSPIDNR